MEKRELVYIKKGKRYEPIGVRSEVSCTHDIDPLGIEVIIRDGNGCSRHWHFASLEAIQNEYDWMHEAMKMRLTADMCATIVKELPDGGWFGKSLSDICELISKHMVEGTLKDARKLRSF